MYVHIKLISPLSQKNTTIYIYSRHYCRSNIATNRKSSRIKLAIMKSILVLTCMCLIGGTRVSGASKRVLDFISFYNGDFDNELQTKEAGDDHDFIKARHIPVDVECLRPNPALLVEEDVNNGTRMILLAEVKDGIEDTVYVTVHYFADVDKYKPGVFKVENLSNISCEDLHREEDCHASYRIMSHGAFGDMQFCNVTVNGEHPRFICIHYCTSFSTSMPMYMQQRSPVEPYEFQLKRQKYPLINPPKDYVSPCRN